MKINPDISVVVPVYNGAGTLKELFLRTWAVMDDMHLSFELLFIDDGSTDNSWQLIRELKTEFTEQVRGFRLARNSGQQAATFCGLQQVRGNWVITLDDDLQSLPEEIPALWAKAQCQQTDVVYGVYPRLKHNFMHNLGSHIYHALLRKVAPNVPDGSSFRLIRKEILNAFPQGLGPWVFVDPALAWLTSDIVTIDVRHEKRKIGHSGYSFSKLLGMAITVLVIYSTFPLRMMIWFGLLSALISFCLGIYYLFQKFTVGAAVGFSALIVTMTFAFGVILLSLGVLGIYISRIYIIGTGQPAFTIKAEI